MGEGDGRASRDSEAGLAGEDGHRHIQADEALHAATVQGAGAEGMLGGREVMSNDLMLSAEGTRRHFDSYPGYRHIAGEPGLYGGQRVVSAAGYRQCTVAHGRDDGLHRFGHS